MFVKKLTWILYSRSQHTTKNTWWQPFNIRIKNGLSQQEIPHRQWMSPQPLAIQERIKRVAVWTLTSWIYHTRPYPTLEYQYSPKAWTSSQGNNWQILIGEELLHRLYLKEFFHNQDGPISESLPVTTDKTNNNKNQTEYLPVDTATH